MVCAAQPVQEHLAVQPFAGEHQGQVLVERQEAQYVLEQSGVVDDLQPAELLVRDCIADGLGWLLAGVLGLVEGCGLDSEGR